MANQRDEEDAQMMFFGYVCLGPIVGLTIVLGFMDLFSNWNVNW